FCSGSHRSLFGGKTVEDFALSHRARGKPSGSVNTDDDQCKSPGQAQPESEWGQPGIAGRKDGKKMNRGVNRCMEENGNQNTSLRVDIEPGEQKSDWNDQEKE